MSPAEVVLRHGLLVLGIVALAAAGLRAASLAAPNGLARVVGATVLAVAAAIAQALVLGLVGLGTNPIALTGAALVTWLAVTVLVRAPEVAPGGELAAWWRRLDRRERIALGAAAGAFAAWAAWVVRHPALGHDMVLYHLPEAITWVQDGSPGSIEPIITGVPVGNYPLTFEVLLAWGMGISRGLTWVTAVTALMPVLLALAGWLGLRTLGVGRLARGLAVAALIATPAVIASQSGGASLDPAALAWLVSCGALCAGAVARPALLVPAVVAAGLAVGTKTTAAPLSLVLLALGAYAARRDLRRLAPALGLAVVAALVVGGVWYVRNVVLHGSPLWPFVAAPWGDPRPPVIELADVRFVDRPGDTIDRLGGYYVDHFGGPLLLFAGAFVAAVVARSRAVAAAAVAAGVAVLIWTNAPFTGVVDGGFDVGTGDATRYLLPGAAAAATALALATRRGGATRWFALVVLALAVVVGLDNSASLGFPSVPSILTPLAGALAGALLVALVTALPLRAPVPGTAVLALACAAIAVAAAFASDGFVERHGATGSSASGVAAWFATQDDWRDGDEPVRSTWSVIGTLAGDRFEHPLELVGQDDACRSLVAGGGAGDWIVLSRSEVATQDAGRCPGARPPGYADAAFTAFAPLPAEVSRR